ncbi:MULTISPECIES: hypothetical protein [Sphingobacterium]|uniref:Uncharacterized protein n=1 Tax=Sphingobacterium ginsenosidimutans TaxID=687845 RepID=A0ABP7ZWQ3_9SPHI|nr:hypothetical protein [Sphingobacterium sp. E70]ULT23387.1 hypothetical protein KUH03_29950 [Sphingobacterium sp. E70]
MNDELLESLKSDLDLEGSFKNGQFGIYSDYRERDDVYFIKANKEGLKLFAYQLLCAAKDFEHQEQEQAFQNIALEEVSWMLKDSEIVLKHIEDPSMIRVSETEATKSSWKDSAVTIGCCIILAFLLISLIVGIYTIINSIL